MGHWVSLPLGQLCLILTRSMEDSRLWAMLASRVREKAGGSDGPNATAPKGVGLCVAWRRYAPLLSPPLQLPLQPLA